MEPIHLTATGIILAFGFVACISAVIFWMLKLPEQTPTTLQVAKAVRMSERANWILVPVQGTALSDRMVALGAQMAKARQARVEVFYVIEVPWALPLSAHLPEAERMAKEALDRARRIAERFDVPLQMEIAHVREASHAIVDEAVNTGADIILMGDLPARGGDTRFSATTAYVFSHAPCEVIVDRPALDGMKPPRSSARFSTEVLSSGR
ncbi:MAG: universal stress protein [Chloroflexi bacterium]|nr:universal stress protein [Chloroflexota bacterium]